MKRNRLAIATFVLVTLFALAGWGWYGSIQSVSAQEGDGGETPEEELAVETDHRKMEILQQDFASAPEVTIACLSCHENSAKEIHETAHWTWEYTHPDTGQVLGKQNVINNFCIAIQSNEPRCTSCHVGYGWADDSFDFSSEENVDCMVCHDTTGTYKKFPTAAGYPVTEPKEFPAGSGNIWEPPDFAFVAQEVGTTSRDSCGACHFYGGGADGVKHGDMDSSLKNPDYALDVHMDASGENFTCTDCHRSEGHEVEGSRYSMNSTDEETCESCHTAEPHEFEMINDHLDRVACQTCHIPEYARGGVATKMWWDWSKAGDLNEDGSLKIIKDENGHSIYDSRKGVFELAEDVVPDYIYFNGDLEYTLIDDKVNPDEVLTINPPLGSIEDTDARIWPMKIFRGIQPYDPVNETLVIPHLYGQDDAAYWKSFEWGPAIEAGMDTAGEPYSGEYDFLETEMFWPITHMVAPAEDALQCNDCHTQEEGRLDFAALGYDDGEVHRLTHFPPTLSLEAFDAPHNSPKACAECHEGEYNSWTDSHHGEKGVGCITCHKLEGEGSGAGEGDDQHPKLAYSVNKSSELCGTCHLDEFGDWEMSGHAAHDEAIVCVDCHEPHTQSQRIATGNITSCENCHKDEAGEVPHSTHGVAELNCLDCHKNTEHSTGHTFLVGSDTCLMCHGKDSHTADIIIQAGVDIQTGESKIHEAEQAVQTETAGGAPPDVTELPDNRLTGVLGLSNWVLIIPALFIVIGGVWVVKGKDPGHEHEENQEQD